jgi:hypothetical protein
VKLCSLIGGSRYGQHPDRVAPVTAASSSSSAVRKSRPRTIGAWLKVRAVVVAADAQWTAKRS